MLEDHASARQAGLCHHRACSLVKLDKVAAGRAREKGIPRGALARQCAVCAQLSANVTGTSLLKGPHFTECAACRLPQGRETNRVTSPKQPV